MKVFEVTSARGLASVRWGTTRELGKDASGRIPPPIAKSRRKKSSKKGSGGKGGEP